MHNSVQLLCGGGRFAARGLAAIALAFAAQMGQAETIGVTVANLSTPFPASLGKAMQATAAQEGVTLELKDAGADRAELIRQVEGFAASGVDAIIVKLGASDDGVAVTRIAREAGVPVVFINQLPLNSKILPEDEVFVGSNEAVAGGLQMQEVCRQMQGQGTVSLLIGDIASVPARRRTSEVFSVLDSGACKGIEMLDAGYANWRRNQAQDLVAGWIAEGRVPDAIVANNDEMALGALAAVKAANLSTDDILIAGVDAMPEMLGKIQTGETKLTVFQNGKGQAETAVKAALALIRGETPKVEPVPFELVTPANLAKFATTN